MGLPILRFKYGRDGRTLLARRTKTRRHDDGSFVLQRILFERLERKKRSARVGGAAITVSDAGRKGSSRQSPGNGIS